MWIQFQSQTYNTQQGHVASSEVRTPLVPIRTKGTKPPLFLVPGPWIPLDYESVDAQFFYYAQLFHLLGDDRPIYGLRTIGLGGRLETYRSVEQMASDYASIVQSVQPQGPYLLAGDCFGGSFAYEIARRLSSESQPVKLVLFDAAFPNKEYKKTVVFLYRSKAIVNFCIRQSKRLGKVISILRHNRLNYRKSVKDIYGMSSSVRHYYKSIEHISYMRFNYEKTLLNNMFAKYCPQPCAVKIALLVTEDMDAHGLHRDWAKVARGGVEVHRIPGGHGSYCNRFVQMTVAIVERIAEG